MQKDNVTTAVLGGIGLLGSQTMGKPENAVYELRDLQGGNSLSLTLTAFPWLLVVFTDTGGLERKRGRKRGSERAYKSVEGQAVHRSERALMHHVIVRFLEVDEKP